MPRNRFSSPITALQSDSLFDMDEDDDFDFAGDDGATAKSANNDEGASSTDRSSPPTRNAANARERARMRVLSRAFCRLKTTLPWVPADTKLSKLDTLRLATSYIAYLRDVLTEDEPVEGRAAPAQDCMVIAERLKRNGGFTEGVVRPERKHPLSLTWPFTFNQNNTSSSHLSSSSTPTSNGSSTAQIRTNNNNLRVAPHQTQSQSGVMNRINLHFPVGNTTTPTINNNSVTTVVTNPWSDFSTSMCVEKVSYY